MAVFWTADMLTQEQAVEIQVLARQGESIRQISRRLGLSRNTVRRYLRDEQAHRDRARTERRWFRCDPASLANLAIWQDANANRTPDGYPVAAGLKQRHRTLSPRRARRGPSAPVHRAPGVSRPHCRTDRRLRRRRAHSRNPASTSGRSRWRASNRWCRRR